MPPQPPPGRRDAAHRPRCPHPPTAPSPTLTLQQPLDDAVDVELVYIRHRLSAAGRSPPRRSASGLAGPTPLLVLSRFCPFLLCAFPRSLCPPRPLSTEPALNKMAAVPSAGSPGARILRARGGPSETLYRPGGKSGRGDAAPLAGSYRSRDGK